MDDLIRHRQVALPTVTVTCEEKRAEAFSIPTVTERWFAHILQSDTSIPIDAFSQFRHRKSARLTVASVIPTLEFNTVIWISEVEAVRATSVYRTNSNLS